MKLTTLLLATCFLTTSSQIASAEKAAPQQKEKSCCCCKAAPKKTNPKEKKSCCATQPTPKAATASKTSIYQLPSTWKDDTGKKRQLSSLAGKVQVITMGYTTCKYACPRLLADMRIIESALTPETRAKTGFVFFSIDPETDTPARLAQYRKEKKIPADRWTLLTADDDTVQELAVLLGLKYRKVGNAQFAHSNLIIVLNQKGEIIHRQEGLSADPKATIKAIETVSSQSN